MPVPQPKGDPVTVHADEGPRPDTTLEKLARLRPVFREGGTVTAGNSSQHQRRRRVRRAREPGARAQALGREPLARIVSTGAAGVDPALHGHRPGPGDAQGARSARASTIDDIDLVELNEAFAAQVLACMRELGHRPRAAERERRRDRARPPARLLGREDCSAR